ncbi:hypothetical protein V6C03_09660 [Methyloligella sp. 2.7D]|uniref:hypothetical protein n=1 Tax=unclassified Methyloligella TaxID=2625955 RepID=UPI00157C4A2C|nr:hypothetical protein [Methyloligella sp. GL2]QKP77887.1 hypothetical protein HT051_10795 [Methyloligella sp. GL2]
MLTRLTSFAIKAAPRAAAAAIAVFAVLSVVAATSAPAAANPFQTLAGYWSGGGTLIAVNGQPERVSCKVTYFVTGPNVKQNIRCASTDYKFWATSALTYGNGRVRGTWKENTYEANGTVSGTASDRAIRVNIAGNKFSGNMNIAVSSRQHTISINQLNKKTGRYSNVANVTLRR